jgi:hypothetical protein
MNDAPGSNLTETPQRKLARNQTLFREINDRIHELAGHLGSSRRDIQIICECSDDTCSEPITVPIADYEQVRHFAARFLVRPGHEIPEIERLISQNSEHIVVEKLGRAATVAAEARRPTERTQSQVAGV